MSRAASLPDYELDDLQIITAPAELKACFHPLRDQLLELVLERAASVAELALAVHRPTSSVAYHVNVLHDAGLLKVVRTRRVRAIEQRFYGRTARVFYVGKITPEQVAGLSNVLVDVARDSGPAHEADRLRAIVRHSRISSAQAAAFWDQLFDLVREFSALPRDGEETFRFVAGLYPTEFPSLPEADERAKRPRRPGGGRR